MAYYRRKRKYTRKKPYTRSRYKKFKRYPKRTRAATTLQRHFRKRRARRTVKTYYKSKATRRLNNPIYSSKIKTYARTLPQSMMFPESRYSQISGSDGVVGVDSTTGTFKLCLQGGMGFFDANVVNAQCSPINTRFIQDCSQYRQVELMCVKYTFIPWNGQYSADEAGVNIDVPLSPCAPQKLAKTGNSQYHGLMLFYHLDSGKYLDSTNIINQTTPVSTGTTTKFSMGSTTNSLTDPYTKLKIINSEQRKSFALTVYPAKYGTELWDRKIDILGAAGQVGDSYRCGGGQRVDCEDVVNFYAGSFAGPQAPNNQALYASTCALPPLSIICQGFPIPIDDAGRNVTRPLYKVIMQTKVRFIGTKAFNRGGNPPP